MMFFPSTFIIPCSIFDIPKLLRYKRIRFMILIGAAGFILTWFTDSLLAYIFTGTSPFLDVLLFHISKAD